MIIHDYTNCSLRDQAFCDVKLADSLFCGADVSGTIFERVTLRCADFTNARLQQARFIDCDLTDACVRGADLRGASFVRCVLTGVTMEEALRDDATYEEATTYAPSASEEGAHRSASPVFDPRPIVLMPRSVPIVEEAPSPQQDGWLAQVFRRLTHLPQ